MIDREVTALDEAHALMAASPGDESARMRFLARLADTELHVLLVAPAEGATLEPELVTHEGTAYALVFDREERLAAFLGRPAPYAAVPGRVLAEMIYQQDIGLAVNLEVAPSAMLLPPEGVDWLVETLQEARPEPAAGRIHALHPPGEIPEALVNELGRRVAGALAGSPAVTSAPDGDPAGAPDGDPAGDPAAAIAGRIYIVEADIAPVGQSEGTGPGASRGGSPAGRPREAETERKLLVAFVGQPPGAEPALARAVAEAVAFAGTESAPVDVLFLAPTDLAVARLAEVGRALMVRPHRHAAATQSATASPPEAAKAPGMDPARPPILR